MISMDTDACSSCGIAISHRSNVDMFESHDYDRPVLTHHLRYSGARWPVWLALLLPVMGIPYVLFKATEHYRLLDSVIIGSVIGCIMFFVIVLVKKYFK
ncbi:hypothetical protein K1X84_05155 [bacterium]|nr:hypothetical protein [bacterium]